MPKMSALQENPSRRMACADGLNVTASPNARAVVGVPKRAAPQLVQPRLHAADTAATCALDDQPGTKIGLCKVISCATAAIETPSTVKLASGPRLDEGAIA